MPRLLSLFLILSLLTANIHARIDLGPAEAPSLSSSAKVIPYSVRDYRWSGIQGAATKDWIPACGLYVLGKDDSHKDAPLFQQSHISSEPLGTLSAPALRKWGSRSVNPQSLARVSAPWITVFTGVVKRGGARRT